jgi:DNA-binding MarR family transcriptional regulator
MAVKQAVLLPVANEMNGNEGFFPLAWRIRGRQYPVYVTTPTPLLPSGHDLAMRLRATYSFLRRKTSAELGPFGMSSDQFVLLTVLAREGPATQQELVHRCHSDTTTLGTMLVLLESKGLVKREAHSDDRRARLVTITGAGKRLQSRLWQETGELRAELAGLFSPDELGVLLGYLDRVVEAMRPERKRAPQLNPSASASGKVPHTAVSRFQRSTPQPGAPRNARPAWSNSPRKNA